MQDSCFPKIDGQKNNAVKNGDCRMGKNCQKIHVAGRHRRKERRRKCNPNSCEKNEHKINKNVFIEESKWE